MDSNQITNIKKNFLENYNGSEKVWLNKAHKRNFFYMSNVQTENNWKFSETIYITCSSIKRWAVHGQKQNKH